MRLRDLSLEHVDKSAYRDDEPQVRLRRVRHPWRAISFVVIVLLLLASAFAAGALIRAPSDEALRASQRTIPIIVAVEERVVPTGFAIPAVVSAGATADVIITTAPTQSASQSAAVHAEDSPATGVTPSPASPPSRTERVVVTESGVSVGDAIGYGRLLAEVSGRPVFAIPSTVPLYRDLLPGDRGNDVAGLQRFLQDVGYGGGQADGVLGSSTLSALRWLYRDAGYELPYIAPGLQGVGWREFASVPVSGARVLQVAAVGTTLDAEVPLMTLEVSAPSLVAQVSVLEREQIAVGSPIGVRVGGDAPIASTVLSVGEFSTSSATGASGYPLVVAVPDGVPTDGSVVLQLVPLDTPPPGPAVPAIAVQQDGDGTFVLALPDAPEPAELDRLSNGERVPIVPVAQADGWVAISSDERLPPGTRLLVER